MLQEVKFEDIPIEKWVEIFKGIPGLGPVDNVEITSGVEVTSIFFGYTETKETKCAHQLFLVELASNRGEKFKYIVMGRNEYNGTGSIRPFKSIRKAISYGETLIMKDSRGHRYYDSYIIQPLLEDKDSFELNNEDIQFIFAIEQKQKQNNLDMSPS